MTNGKAPQEYTDDEWVTASDALDELEERLGGRASAKATLAELIRDGKLRTRADYVFLSDRKGVDEAWRRGAEVKGLEVGSNLELERIDWNESVQWAEDLDLWQWPESQFVITNQLRPLIRTYFKGVYLSFDELEALDSRRQQTVNMAERAKRGRTPDVVRWTTFWLSVVELAQNRKLNLGEFPSQAALSRELRDMMGSGALSEEAVEPRVRQIWGRFIDD